MKNFYTKNFIFSIDLILSTIKKYTDLLVFDSTVKKAIMVLALFFVQSVVMAQTAGDFRSKATGNWTALASWERWNGTDWVQPTALQGYPAQMLGTQTVTIRNTHTITLSGPFHSLFPFGALVVGGGVSGILAVDDDVTIPTTNVTINVRAIVRLTGPNNGNYIRFPQNGNIKIHNSTTPGDGGKFESSTCNNNSAVYLGSVKFSVCAGNGNATNTFTIINEDGGTLRAAPTSNSPVCQGNTINLRGGYSGYTSTAPTNSSYSWTVTTPAGTSTVTVGKDLDIPNAVVGIYTAQLTVTTPYESTPYSNSETIYVTVNPLSTAIISGTTTVCKDVSSPSIAFTGSGGTAPYTFIYKINTGSNLSVTTTSGNSSVTVAAPTGTAGSFVYNLVSVQDSKACSQAQTGTATVTVNPLPTASISGTASVCKDANSPNITFTGAGGTAPYTFTYKINTGSNLTVTTTNGNSVIIAAPTGTVGSFTYSLINVRDASSTTCSQVQTGAATITVNPTPATPTLIVSQPDCTTSKGTIRITAPIGMNYSINGTDYTNTSGIFNSLIVGSYNVTAKNSSGCISTTVQVIIVASSQTTTWNGTGWTNGSPTFSMEAIINEDYNTATHGNLDACSLKINGPRTLTIGANGFVTIQNDLIVQPNSTLNVLNQGSLVMVNDLGLIDNKGIIKVHKTTSSFEKYDYTYWSSPIVGPANIGSTFPTWNTNYAFAFHPENFIDADNDGFDDNQDDYIFASTMTPGRGYVIMGPTTGTFPRTESVVFTGTVNNGVLTTPIELTPGTDPDDDFNLVGNPYPSAISADALIRANIGSSGTINKTIEGTLYFWTHKDDISPSNPGPQAYNYSQDDYAMYTLAGGIGTLPSVSGGAKPSGYIASGQGFFVEAVTSGLMTFNNSMRVSPSFNSSPTNANSQFYKILPVKDKTIVKDRVWLNLENEDGMFSQQLVGYLENTTKGIDNGYDGLVSDAGNYVSFYSFIDDKSYKIQGRGIYDEKDEVPLGYFSAVAGKFNINIDSQDGVFNEATTNVYLEDKLTKRIHNLKNGAYTFDTESGTFNERFLLSYVNNTAKTLATGDFELAEKGVLVSCQNKAIKVNSSVEIIDKVVIYDMSGRQIYKNTSVNNKDLVIPNIQSPKQILLVKVELQNGQSVTQKIIY